MAFGNYKTLTNKPGMGGFVTPLAALAAEHIAITNLKTSALSLAQARDVIANSLAVCCPMDITGVGRIRAIGRLKNLASIVCSTDARVMFFGGIGKLSRTGSPGSEVCTISNIKVFERLDADGTLDTPATFDGTQGQPVGIPASPSSSNMIVGGDYLFTKAIRFTDENGVKKPYLDVASYNFLIAVPVQAAVGAAVTGESFELIVTSAN